MKLSSVTQAFTEEKRHFPAGAHEIYMTDQPGVRKDLLAHITPLIEKSISDGYYPGAVLLASHQSQIIYRGVFGNQRVTPEIKPMCFETIFDVASLTKVIVTTTAIMQLIEAGQLELETPVTHYWSEFAKNGKDQVTIRELLTHLSGFQAILPTWAASASDDQRYSSGLQQIERLRLINPPGKVFTYSDINFIVLGYLVELISGERLDHYAERHIFKPLNMASSTFLPPTTWQDQIAPTSSPEDQQLRWGRVNDPTTERMGGVTGTAGLFSNAQDLNTFLQCLLKGGRVNKNDYLLGPLTILKMTTAQTPPEILDARGLGWDIDSGYSSRGVLLPLCSFGHTGWTGVSACADPATQTSIIMLTSRSYPTLAKTNQLIKDRRAIANIIAASLTDISTQNLITTGLGELSRAYTTAPPTQLGLSQVFN